MKLLYEPKQDNIIIPIGENPIEYINKNIWWGKSEYYEDEEWHIQKIPKPVVAISMSWYENYK